MRILIIDDEFRLANSVKRGLVENGFAVDVAFDGKTGQHLAETEKYNLLILDLMLPKIDGITVCKELRNKNIKTPIIMLTAKSNIEDRIAGLDSGADDYLTKPFSFLELRFRVQALLRRSKQETALILKIADLEVDPSKHIAKRGENIISLTPKEFAILEFLLRHKGKVLTRAMIIEHVWDYSFEGMSNIVDAFITSIRKKIDKKAKIKLIHTIHGVGYKVGLPL